MNMEQILFQEKIADANVLIHACCGPCLEWPLQQMLAENILPVIYFYNPNIHPAVENQRRLENLERVATTKQLPCISDPLCDPDPWTNYSSEAGSRCDMCYRVRMTAAAKKTKELGLSSFTTTLLVSPYQDHEAIIAAGQEAGRQFGVEFLARDFRPGFREGQRMAREDGLYRQKYCGCLISLEKSNFKARIKQEHQDLSEQP